MKTSNSPFHTDGQSEQRKVCVRKRGCMAAIIILLAVPTVLHAQSAQQLIAEGRLALGAQNTAKLIEANKAFMQAAKVDPNNDEAVVLKALTSFMLESQNPGLQTIMRDLGITIASGDIYNANLIPNQDADGVLVPVAGRTTASALTYINARINARNSFVDGLIADTQSVTDRGIQVTLSPQETGENKLLIDYADVLMSRAFLRFVKAFGALANSFNLSAEYKLFYDLFKGENLTPRELLRRLPNTLKFTKTNQRSAALTHLQSALAEMEEAIGARVIARSLPGDTHHLFEIETENLESLNQSLNEMRFFAAALQRTTTVPDTFGRSWKSFAGKRLNLAQFFNTNRDPRSLVPGQFSEDGAFLREAWPDATIAGIFPHGESAALEPFAAGLYYRLGQEEARFILEPAIYRPYNFQTIHPLSQEWYATGGLALEQNGNALAVDDQNRTVKRITPSGQSGVVFTADETPEDPGYGGIYGLGVDSSGRIYYSDGWRVFKREVSGAISLLAGSYNDYEARDGTGDQAVFGFITGLTVDLSGNVYVVDNGGIAVRKISPNGEVTTLAGSATWNEGSYGYRDGPGNQARFSYIYGSIGVDSMGNVYVCDPGNHAIRKITPAGETSTLVGGPSRQPLHYDGPADEALLYTPSGLAVDHDGSIFFADGSTIRRLTPGQSVETVGGRPETPGSRDGIGKLARFGDQWSWQPNYLGVAQDGTLWLATQQRVLTATSAPIITSQPSSAEAAHGQSVIFTVGSGAGNPRYQWSKDGQPIRGATQASLTITASLATAGIYTVSVSNDIGSDTSSAASLKLRDSGLLVYELAGTGFAADPSRSFSRREAAVVVIDRENQLAALIWHTAGPSGKFYRVEYPDNTSMHSTGPFAGSVSVLSRAITEGEHPDTEKDILWFTGTDSLNRLNGRISPVTNAIAPTRMAGAVQTLSLADGVAIETLNASLILNPAQTQRTRNGLGESLLTAVERIASEFAARGFINTGL